MMHMDLLFAYTLLPFPVFIVEGEPPGCPGVGSPIRPTAMLLKNTFGLPLEITLAGWHDNRSPTLAAAAIIYSIGRFKTG
jgi:hypothetical protein